MYLGPTGVSPSGRETYRLVWDVGRGKADRADVVCEHDVIIEFNQCDVVVRTLIRAVVLVDDVPFHGDGLLARFIGGEVVFTKHDGQVSPNDITWFAGGERHDYIRNISLEDIFTFPLIITS